MDLLKQRALPELLAPAGSFDSLCAAVEAGASAVYFGTSDFNARMRAENFSEEDAKRAVRLCREYGVKSHITFNTRLKESELMPCAERALDLYRMGADAFIVADAALAMILKKAAPQIELHASTQLSGHNSFDARQLQKMGFSRMVCPRELSFEEIKALVLDSPIDIEMFIHGAHCVSFSGQCMMSFAMGGRSGNRGSCAQPCRLPFILGNAKSSFPLSLKDMCLAGSIQDIISTGVASLKIEGRQKSPEYVYGVCRVYRRLLDEKRNASDDEIAELSRLFCRGGFTDGYFKKSYGTMLGVRSLKEFENSREVEPFGGLKRKIPISAKLRLKIGEAASLEISDGTRCARVSGETVAKDAEHTLSLEAARGNTARLGNTAFTLDKFEFEADESAFYTLSGINRLRRAALEELVKPMKERTVLCSDKLCEKDPGANTKFERPDKILRTAEFVSFSQVGKNAVDFFDRIYIPLSDIAHADGVKICVSLDPILLDCELAGIKEKLSGYRGEILVHGFGQAKFARELGLMPIASFRFNVFSSSDAELISEYAVEPALSPEVPLGAARDLKVPFSLIVYGKIPLMHTARCLLSDGGTACSFCGAGGKNYPRREKRDGNSGKIRSENGLCRGTLIDRKGVTFPVVGLSDCTNIIYNSVPIYMADRQEAIKLPFVARHHFIFSDENASECDAVVASYKSFRFHDKNHAIRRLK